MAGLKFYYLKKDILFPNFNGQTLDKFLQQALIKINFNFNPENPAETTVIIPDEVRSLIDALCKAVKQLKSMGENYTATYLATNMFTDLTSFSEKLKNGGRIIHACSYLQSILDIVWNLELENEVKIHKGHPYFFLAFYHLLLGDLDTGFVYAYNAIKEDEILGTLCPELGYPQNAPIYRTTLLVDDRRNRMYASVKELRRELETLILSYNVEFNKSFTIGEFDKKFLQNESNSALLGPRYFFTFTLWSIMKQKSRLNSQIQNNEFSKLRNLNWIFNLCLIIDKILEANQKIKKRFVGQNVEKVFEIEGFMSAKDLVEQVNKKYSMNFHKDDPDKVLKTLLPMNLKIGSQQVPKLAIHYLIAWRLRNYGGHNIRLQKCLVDRFDEIFKILMMCLLHSVNLL